MDNYALLKWVDENNIKKRTLGYFWCAFNNYINGLSSDEIQEYFGKYNQNEVKIWIQSISHKYIFWDYYDISNKNQDLIEVRVNVAYKNDENFDSYYTFYDFSGEVIDDSFGSDWEVTYKQFKKKVLNEIQNVLNEKALLEGIGKNEITTINRIIEEYIDKRK